MSESEETAEAPKPFGQNEFLMTVTVPGEDRVYKAHHLISDLQLESIPPDVDLADTVIAGMFSALQNKRREVMWGTCEVPDCDRPNQKNRKKCHPHTWEEQRDANTDASAQHPPAL